MSRISRTEELTSQFSLFRTIQTVFSTALIVATLFTLWTPANLFSGQIFDSMLFAFEEIDQEDLVVTPTPFVSGTRIGIVAGHWKDTQNSGFTCKDGLTEEQLNLKIATLVAQTLLSKGYQVDLLEEFDPRLTQYKSLAIISIHNDSCEYLGDDATGYKVSPALANSYPDKADVLAECMITNYKQITGMTFQTNKVTSDMTTYHTFNEVHSTTPVIILETGYLNLDRQILTEQTAKISNGIVEGILCYVEGEELEMEVTTTP